MCFSAELSGLLLYLKVGGLSSKGFEGGRVKQDIEELLPNTSWWTRVGGTAIKPMS